MAKGFNVASLTDYVKTNEDVILKSVVAGTEFGDTISNLKHQPGIKTKERLNYIDVDPTLQDGSACGFTPDGNTTFSERDIETAQFKVQDEYCDKDLLGKFAEYQVKIAATKDAEDMPFGRVLMSEIVKNINKKMEKAIWQGEKGSDLIDGFVTLAEAEGSTVKVTVANGTTAYQAIKQVIMAIPEEILDRAVVFVSPALYRSFVQELVELNYYHYQSGKIEAEDLVFPGTDIRVHKTLGLTGDSKHIYASCYDNMVYGYDMMGDNEKVRLWYDDNTELFKYSIHWNAGVQTLFPDMVVLATSEEDIR